MTEGVFPKSDGEILYGSEINKLYSESIKATILGIANVQKTISNYNSLQNMAILAGVDYLVEGFGNSATHDTSTLPMDSFVTKYGLPYWESTHNENRAYICKLNTELEIGAGVAGTSDISTLDLYALGKDSEFIMGLTATFASGGPLVNVQISNGSTHVSVFELGGSFSPPDYQRYVIRVKLDYSGKNAYVSSNGGAFGSPIDISSVTTNWFIRIVSNSGDAALIPEFVGYVDGSTDTVNYTSATKTMVSTKSKGIMTWDTNSTSTITGYLSANGGSNYTTAAKDTWTTIANTGTTAKIKLTCTLPGTIEATDAVDYIKEIRAAGAYFT